MTDQKAQNRARFPELAAILDTLEPGSFRVRRICDADGNVVASNFTELEMEPVPNEFTLSGDAIAAMERWYRLAKVKEPNLWGRRY